MNFHLMFNNNNNDRIVQLLEDISSTIKQFGNFYAEKQTVGEQRQERKTDSFYNKLVSAIDKFTNEVIKSSQQGTRLSYISYSQFINYVKEDRKFRSDVVNQINRLFKYYDQNSGLQKFYRPFLQELDELVSIVNPIQKIAKGIEHIAEVAILIKPHIRNLIARGIPLFGFGYGGYGKGGGAPYNLIYDPYTSIAENIDSISKTLKDTNLVFSRFVESIEFSGDSLKEFLLGIPGLRSFVNQDYLYRRAITGSYQELTPIIAKLTKTGIGEDLTAELTKDFAKSLIDNRGNFIKSYIDYISQDLDKLSSNVLSIAVKSPQSKDILLKLSLIGYTSAATRLFDGLEKFIKTDDFQRIVENTIGKINPNQYNQLTDSIKEFRDYLFELILTRQFDKLSEAHFTDYMVSNLEQKGFDKKVAQSMANLIISNLDRSLGVLTEFQQDISYRLIDVLIEKHGAKFDKILDELSNIIDTQDKKMVSKLRDYTIMRYSKTYRILESSFKFVDFMTGNIKNLAMLSFVLPVVGSIIPATFALPLLGIPFPNPLYILASFGLMKFGPSMVKWIGGNLFRRFNFLNNIAQSIRNFATTISNKLDQTPIGRRALSAGLMAGTGAASVGLVSLFGLLAQFNPLLAGLLGATLGFKLGSRLGLSFKKTLGLAGITGLGVAGLGATGLLTKIGLMSVPLFGFGSLPLLPLLMGAGGLFGLLMPNVARTFAGNFFRRIFGIKSVAPEPRGRLSEEEFKSLSVYNLESLNYNLGQIGGDLSNKLTDIFDLLDKKLFNTVSKLGVEQNRYLDSIKQTIDQQLGNLTLTLDQILNNIKIHTENLDPINKNINSINQKFDQLLNTGFNQLSLPIDLTVLDNIKNNTDKLDSIDQRLANIHDRLHDIGIDELTKKINNELKDIKDILNKKLHKDMKSNLEQLVEIFGKNDKDSVYSQEYKALRVIPITGIGSGLGPAGPDLSSLLSLLMSLFGGFGFFPNFMPFLPLKILKDIWKILKHIGKGGWNILKRIGRGGWNILRKIGGAAMRGGRWIAERGWPIIRKVAPSIGRIILRFLIRRGIAAGTGALVGGAAGSAAPGAGNIAGSVAGLIAGLVAPELVELGLNKLGITVPFFNDNQQDVLADNQTIQQPNINISASNNGMDLLTFGSSNQIVGVLTSQLALQQAMVDNLIAIRSILESRLQSNSNQIGSDPTKTQAAMEEATNKTAQNSDSIMTRFMNKVSSLFS